MYKCPECKHRNTNEDLYCRSCGAYLVRGRINSDYRDLLISLIIGLLVWGCFYNYGVEIFLDHTTYIYRIFTIHWICRLVALIFFWAGTYMLTKYLEFRREKKHFATFTSAEFSVVIRAGITEQNADSVINRFQDQLGHKKFEQFSTSLVFTRFYKTIEFLKAVPKREEMHSILNYRAELDMAAIQSQFSIVKIFSWVMPILGFIGTVLGISEAIKGFSGNISNSTINTAVPQEFSNQIMQGLNSVTGGLTTAFDTTYIALMLVIPITFAVGFLEKAYDDYLNFLENYFLSAVVPHILIGLNTDTPTDNSNELADLKHTSTILHEQLKNLVQTISELNKHLLVQQNKQLEQ